MSLTKEIIIATNTYESLHQLTIQDRQENVEELLEFFKDTCPEIFIGLIKWRKNK